jgi:hypothetical protein
MASLDKLVYRHVSIEDLNSKNHLFFDRLVSIAWETNAMILNIQKSRYLKKHA